MDFEAADRGPGRPTRLRADLDEGDHLHLNAAGHQVLGEAVDLRLLDVPRP